MRLRPMLVFSTLPAALVVASCAVKPPLLGEGEGDPATRGGQGVCAPGWTAYGLSVGGFCCSGTTDGDTCQGTACAVDPARSQGLQLCSRVFCAPGSTYYGASVGGFCCPGTQTGGNMGSCSGSSCALDPNQSQGSAVCPQSPGLCAPGWFRYGESVGGFCCHGKVGDNESCTGEVCALDPTRPQGNPTCSFDLCAPGSTYYGAGVGGFCCAGTQTGGNLGSCNITACSLDPDRRQGTPLCSAAGGAGWTKAAGSLIDISAGSATQAAGVTAKSGVVRWTGNAWVQFPGGTAENVSIAADGTMWALFAGGKLERWNANAWQEMPGTFSRVTVGNANTVWALNAQGGVFRWTGGNTFETIAGAFTKSVSAGSDGTVWCVTASDEIWRWTGTTWAKVPGLLNEVYVGSANTVWGITSQGNVLKYNAGTNAWDAVPGSFQRLAVASDGTVWGLGGDRSVWQFGVSAPASSSVASSSSSGSSSSSSSSAASWASATPTQVMCGVLTTGLECGVETFQCGWKLVEDGLTCGWDTVASGVRGCAYDTVKKAVTDGLKCGTDTIVDGAKCGWSTFTNALSCLGHPEFYTTFKCDVANTCSLPKSCQIDSPVSKSCQLPKSCNIAQNCSKERSCQISSPCGAPTSALDILRHADALGGSTCRPDNDVLLSAGCCGSPGNRGCVVGSVASILALDANLSGACTGPSGNALRMDPYSRVPLCDFPPPSCGPGIASALTGDGDTFFTTSDLHYFRPGMLPVDQIAHVKVLNDWAAASHDWKTYFGLPTTSGDMVAKPRAVIVNGDMTLDSVAGGLSAYRMLYEMGRHAEGIQYPVFVGLGNHETAYNVADAQAAKRMFDYLTDDMNCTGIAMDVNRVAPALGDDVSGLKDQRSGSGNYSWDFGNVHHVQLNVWAGDNSSKYTRAADGVAWLVEDLRTHVGSSGRPVVLHQHYWLGEWGDWSGKVGGVACTGQYCWDHYVYPQIRDYNIVAIFAGHYHQADVLGNNYVRSNGDPFHIDTFRSGMGGGRLTDTATLVMGDFIVARINGPYLDVGHVEWDHGPGAPISVHTLAGKYYGDPNATSCRKRITDKYVAESSVTAAVAAGDKADNTERKVTLTHTSGTMLLDKPLAVRLTNLKTDKGLLNRTFTDGCSRDDNATSAYLLLTDAQLSLLNQNQPVVLTLEFAADPGSPTVDPVSLVPLGGS